MKSAMFRNYSNAAPPHVRREFSIGSNFGTTTISTDDPSNGLLAHKSSHSIYSESSSTISPFKHKTISIQDSLTQAALLEEKPIIQIKMATKPTIILIPGIWEGPKVYSEVSSSLSALSYPTKSISLPSTGTTSDSKISMHDDIASIRSDIAPLIENENQDLILVCHSAAGYLGSGAIEGLGWKQRQANGLKGGVKRLVFVAAGLADVGYVHENRPFMEIDVSFVVI